MSDNKYIRQQARFYLSKWERLEQKERDGTITESEAVQKHILLLSLNNVSADSRTLLRTRYTLQEGSNRLITNEEAAKRLEISKAILLKQIYKLQQQVGERLVEVKESHPQERYPPSLLRKTHYYLRKWFSLQEKINSNALNDIELIDAKILFLSLDKLEASKINLLKAKYFHPLVNGQLPKEEIISNNLGMTKPEYKKEIRKVENELSAIMANIVKVFEKERERAILLLYDKKR